MKKKIISLLLAFSLLVSVFAVLPAMSAVAATNTSSVLGDEEKNASVVTIMDGANGTASAPVEIWNKEQLIDFAKRVSGDGYEANSRFSAILKADIELNPGYTFELDYDAKLVAVYKDGVLVNYVDPGYNNEANCGKWLATDKTTAAEMPEGFTVWSPIGTKAAPYYGSFNGNGCKVSGVYVAQKAYHAGFIGYTGSYFASDANTAGSYASSITGLTVKDSLVIGAGYSGAVVGSIMSNANATPHTDACTITSDTSYNAYPKPVANSLSNENSVVVSIAVSGVKNERTGGVIGNFDSINHSSKKTTFAALTGCTNSGDVLSEGEDVGGVIGYCGRTTPQNLTNYGNVWGTNYVAGIAGRHIDAGNATNLVNHGNVVATNGNAAGIIGFTYRSLSVALNTGSVKANGNAAGMIAQVQDGTGYKTLANVGTIESTRDNALAGGIIAEFAAAGKTVEASYNAGEIISKGTAAGIVPTAKTLGFIKDCYSVKANDRMLVIGVAANEAVAIRCSEVSAEQVKNGALLSLLGSGFGQVEGDAYPVPGKSGSISLTLEGEGTAEAPYLIYDEFDLRAFATLVNSGAAKYAYAELMADVNLNRGIDMKLVEKDTLVQMTAQNGSTAYYGTGVGKYTIGVVYHKSGDSYAQNAPANWPGLTEWTPIGTDANPYYGHFDGNGHTVSGIYTYNKDYSGLFGLCGTDNVSGFTVDGVKVKSSYVWGRNGTGAIVGRIVTTLMPGSDNIAHTHTVTKDANGNVVSYECSKGATYNVKESLNAALSAIASEKGGVKSFSVTNCETLDTAVCTTSGHAGGIIGMSVVNNHRFKVTVVELDADGNVAKETVGTSELVHRVRGGCIVQNLVNRAVVSGNSQVAGIYGEAATGEISYCYNYGTVYCSAASYAAGIAAGTNNVTLSKLFNYGKVTCVNGYAAGINVLSFRAPSNSYNAGNVTGKNAAGITCYLRDVQTFNNNANVGNVTAAAGVAGGIFAIGRTDHDTKPTFNNCYNTGVLTADDGVAAIAIVRDTKTSTFTINNCYTTGEYVFADRNKVEANIATITNCATVTVDQAAKGYLLSKLGSAFGQSVNMAAPVPGFTTTFAGNDVTLKDGILLNFYVEVSGQFGDTYDGAVLTTVGNKQYYKVTVPVAAKEMADVQSVTIGGVTYKMSVAEYAEGILAGNYDAETKALVNAMLNYGAAAQKYFDYNTDNLVGTPVTDTSALEGAEVSAPTLTDREGKFIGASLILEGTLKLRFYFLGNVEVTVDGAAVSAVATEKYCYVDVDVTPDNIDKFYEVASGETVVRYSALNYLKNNVAKAELAEMVASIYAYNVAADAFVAKKAN